MKKPAAMWISLVCLAVFMVYTFAFKNTGFNDPNPKKRIAAIMAIRDPKPGRVLNLWDAERLLKMMNMDQDPEVRYVACLQYDNLMGIHRMHPSVITNAAAFMYQGNHQK